MGTAEEALRKKALLYDKDGEEHYNLISALPQEPAGSDPDRPPSTGWRGCSPRGRPASTSPRRMHPVRLGGYRQRRPGGRCR